MAWKPIKQINQENSEKTEQLVQDMLTLQIAEDTLMENKEFDYINEVAPLTVKALPDDFSTCSIQKDNGKPNLSSQYLADTCKNDWKLMCFKIMRKSQVISFSQLWRVLENAMGGRKMPLEKTVLNYLFSKQLHVEELLNTGTITWTVYAVPNTQLLILNS